MSFDIGARRGKLLAEIEYRAKSAEGKVGIRSSTGLREDWIKVKNRQHPAFSRVMDQF